MTHKIQQMNARRQKFSGGALQCAFLVLAMTVIFYPLRVEAQNADDLGRNLMSFDRLNGSLAGLAIIGMLLVKFVMWLLDRRKK